MRIIRCFLTINVYVEGLLNPTSVIIYEEANAFAEKWINIITFVFVKVTLPGITIPFFLISYLLYFTTDLGEDSFLLPFVAW